MKIDQTLNTPEAAQNPRPRGPLSPGQGASFQDVLSRAVSQPQSHPPVEKPGLQPVGAGPGDGPPVWHRINGVLDSLERYGHALGDQGRSLKEIEPLAQDLEQRVEDLQAGLPDDGHPLRQLAGEVLAQAQVAALKYRRGDYL